MEHGLLPFVVIFLIAGIVMFIAGRKLEGEATRAARWPTVAGTLVRCEVVEKRSMRSDEPSSWDLAVEYSYVVRGVTYHGTRYAFGYGGGIDDQKYRAVAEALAQAPRLSVHYDPKHPGESVLDTTVPTGLTSLGLTGLVMAVVSALFGLVRICT